MAHHNQVGKWGEDVACEKLVREGYAIRDRNWRMGHYEVDIIAVKGDTVVFCEVKTRSGYDYDPLDAITKRKIAHMVASANVYMEAYKLPHNVRFDVFGVSGYPEDFKIEHISDAFDVPLTRI